MSNPLFNYKNTCMFTENKLRSCGLRWAQIPSQAPIVYTNSWFGVFSWVQIGYKSYCHIQYLPLKYSYPIKRNDDTKPSLHGMIRIIYFFNCVKKKHLHYLDLKVNNPNYIIFFSRTLVLSGMWVVCGSKNGYQMYTYVNKNLDCMLQLWNHSRLNN